MAPFNLHNPQCPQCSSPCSSDYRCQYCNCNIHVFCCLDFEKTGEMGHGAHYRCSRPDCVHDQTTVTVRTSPRTKIASSSKATEVAPQKLNFITQPATASLPTKNQPHQYPVSHRNAWADSGNAEAKCSLARQSKCRNKGDLLRRCVIESCAQYIHEKCCIKMMAEKQRDFFLDKEQAAVLICSVSCHNKLLKTEKSVEDPKSSGKQWDNDNNDVTKTSEMLL
jgi:hypothetical protein